MSEQENKTGMISTPKSAFSFIDLSIKEQVDYLNNIEKVNGIWSVDYYRKKDKKYDYMDNRKTGKDKTYLKIWTNLYNAQEIRKFIEWISNCLNIHEWSKKVDSTIYYDATLGKIDVSVFISVLGSKKLETLSEISGCNIVEKEQRYTTYVCENKA